jgi:hypothetical protein
MSAELLSRTLLFSWQISGESIYFHVLLLFDPLTQTINFPYSHNQVRVLKLSENIGWRDATIPEAIVYVSKALAFDFIKKNPNTE